MNNILKMDSKLIIIIAIVITFILGLLVGHVTSDRYYFMKEPAGDAIAIYRCDKITGNVELIVYSQGRMKTIKLE
ncbi:MAG: hypothetical protein MUP30_11750 [Deltaproteobacteria bacterium]|nr:hypothetical protein [Deltaproteobacteria bacterium]